MAEFRIDCIVTPNSENIYNVFEIPAYQIIYLMYGGTGYMSAIIDACLTDYLFEDILLCKRINFFCNFNKFGVIFIQTKKMCFHFFRCIFQFVFT